MEKISNKTKNNKNKEWKNKNKTRVFHGGDY
jgi:hypothetical protein